MQMAVIEATLNDAGRAAEGQFDRIRPATPEPVVGLITEWLRGNELERRKAQGTSLAAHDGSAPIAPI